jgi:phage terminase large subunit
VYPDAFLQRKFLDRPEGWEWFQMSLNENRRSRGGYLEDIHVDEMVRDWPAEIREVRVEGKFAGFQGAVWPMFSVRHIVRPFRIPASWQRYIFIDFGWTDPFVALWQARSPEGQWAVCHEYYQARRLYDEHADQIWQRGSKFWSPQECRAILADPEDLQGRQELARRGIHCQPFSKGKYSLMKGIDLLGTLMNDWRPALHGVDSPDGKMPAWVVFEGCDNAIREHASYQWSESSRRGLANSPNRDLPRMRDDHTCDANRGGIFTVERQMGNVPEDYRHVDAKAVRDDSGRPVKSLMRSRFISLEDKPVSGGAIWQLPSP